MPGVEGQPPSQQELQELRKMALQKIQEVGKEKFYTSDVEKISKNDFYLTRFWLHVFDLSGKQIDEACHMVIETLRWRKEFQVETINEETVKPSFFEKGVLYCHNRDKDGRKLLVFCVGKHSKGVEKMDDLKRFFIYYLERMEREENGQPITIVFDCRNAGVKNMDMEFIQYIIGVFKDYYPDMLNYILVLDMPWVLNAAWKIIKAWLPAAAVKKIKFLTKSNMDEYVDEKNRLVAWGGADTWEYEFEPEARPMVFANSYNSTEQSHMLNGSSVVEAIEDSSRIDDPNKRKTVTFAGEMASSQSSESISSFVSTGKDILRLSPGSEAVFYPSSKGELMAKVMIQNICDRPVGFKIKTTTPEIYRVRPSHGVLEKGQESCVEIHMVKQPPGGISKDKFLVTAIFLDEADLTNGRIQELLRKNKPEKEYRIRCQFPADSGINTVSVAANHMAATPQYKMPAPSSMEESAKQIATIVRKISELTEKHNEMERQVSLNLKLQLVLMVLSLLLLIIVWIYLPSGTPTNICSGCPSQAGALEESREEL